MKNKGNIWKVTDIKEEKVRDNRIPDNSIKDYSQSFNIRLARTLYNNYYRARLQGANGEEAGQLLIIPGLPLDRSQLPDYAPVANPFLLVIVEDANINKDNVVDFEENISRALLTKFKTETTVFSHCEFYYPSPAFYFAQEE